MTLSSGSKTPSVLLFENDPNPLVIRLRPVIVDKYTISALINGLDNDEPHHKQWYIEKALRQILGPSEFDRIKEIEKWESGKIP